MIRVAINGFGRMGRLALRASWSVDESKRGYEIVHINEIAGDVTSAAHLLKYDSVHGTWDSAVETVVEQSQAKIVIDGKSITYSQNRQIEATSWQEMGVDLVVECTGQFKTSPALAPYFEHGVKKVVVSAPVKDGPLNVVVGVNDHLYRPDDHHIVTAASCTTNCIAPVIQVIQGQFGIRHGSFTTIHDITNTQSLLDQHHKDLRRARASAYSLIPTSTGSATAITELFPALKGRISGIAVRVPVANASLTDCVFEVDRQTSIEEVNRVFRQAAETGPLAGILGYEEHPLVSVDYKGDTRSSIVDGPLTMVIDGTQLKVFAWYDNEIGYVHRMMELVAKIARSM